MRLGLSLLVVALLCATTPVRAEQTAAEKSAPQEKAPTPLHKKWWVWTAAAGALIVVVGVVVGVSLVPKSSRVADFEPTQPDFLGPGVTF